MPKTFPAPISTEVNKVKASEPLIVVEVQWSPSTVKYYSEADYGLAEGRLLEVSSIATIVKVGDAGSTSSASVTLSDTDGFIKAILGTHDVHKVPVNIYLAYANLGFDDKYLLLTGELNSPAVWDDAERTFSFAIISKIEDRQVGFSPEQAVDDVISEDAVGKAWPLCFGSPLHVPAVRINEQPVGTALFRVSIISGGTTSQICSLAKQYRQYERIQETADLNTLTFLDNTAYQAVLNNLGSAATSLTQAVNSAIQAGGSPSVINSLITACKNLQDAETDRGFWLGQSAEATAGIESSQQTITSLNEQITSTQAELATAQAADPQDPARISFLQASIVSLQASLNIAQDQEEGFTGAKATADVNAAAALSDIGIYSTQAQNAEDTLIRVQFPQIIVKGGEKFPQGEVLSIIVNGLVFAGTFAGEVFTTTQNVALNLNDITPNALGNNPQGGAVISSIGSFTYAGDLQLQGQYAWLGNSLIYINSQFEGLITYTPALFQKTGAVKYTILNEPRDIYALRTVSGFQEISPYVRPEWLAKLRQLDTSGELPAFASGLSNISFSDFTINVGDQIRLLTAMPEVYVANLLPSTEVKEVMAYRVIESGERRLVPVPSSLYTINLSASLLGQTPTTITLKQVLSSRRDENWEDDLYVSLTSTVGPNTSDILKYLVETYSSLTADATSFATLATQLTEYPSHFALLERSNVLSVLEDISWQARTATFIRNGVAFVKYLALETASVETVDNDNTEFGKLQLEISTTEDIVTVFKALWNTEYTEEEKKEVVLRNNIPKYGTIEKEFEFSIYNIENLVVKSATFWMIRYSNTWKRAKLTAMFNTFQLDEFDNLTLDYGENIFGSSPIKGTVEAIDFDSETMSLVYDIWTSVRCGELTQYPFAWPANANPALDYPTAADLFAGGAAT